MQSPGTQSFYRGSDRILGGVCSGLAEGFHVEVLWVRLVFVVLTFLNGVGFLLYVVLWVLMPERAGNRPSGQSAFESMGADVKRAWADLRAQFSGSRPTTTSPSTPAQPPPPIGAAPPVSGEPAPPVQTNPIGAATRSPSFILGAILVVLGIAFLASNLNIVSWGILWPAALVALGVALLIRNIEKRSDK